MTLEKHKKNFFYILVVLIFYLMSKSSILISEKFLVSQDIMLIISSIIFTIILYFFNNIIIKDSFYFELTPEKHCEGGPYMYSSNPIKKKFCSQFKPSDIKYFSCDKGFHGAPVHWSRTNMSDSNWENKMCDGNFKKYEDPEVL